MATVAAIGTWIAANSALTVAAGAVAGSVYSAVKSTNAQADALERAGDITGAAELRRIGIEQEKLELSRELIAEGKPLREALVESGLQALPGLTEFADISKAGTGPGFTLPLRQGLRSLSSELAPFGSTLGTSPGLTAGVTERLLSSDIDRRLGASKSLLGLAPGSVGSGISLAEQTGGTGLAKFQSSLASLSPQAGLFGGISDLLGGIGGQLTTGLLNSSGGGTTGGAAGGGNFIGNFDSSRFTL